MSKKFSLALMTLLMLASLLSLAFAQDEEDDMMMMEDVILLATDMDGFPADFDTVPEGYDTEAWFQASADAFFDMDNDTMTDTVTVTADGLVPDGLYTAWWVNTQPEMSMGPAAGPEASFTADQDGNAEISFEVASDNDYQWLVLAFHADGNTYGEEPGAMGEITFSHLIGAFPGPEGLMDMQTSVGLEATEIDGIPQDIEAEAWNEADVSSYAVQGMDGAITVAVDASGLVAEGLYTAWWVNNMDDMENMSMGPAAGPEGSFIADEDGNAFYAFEIPADADYQTLVLAFHADGNTYGEDPGAMGEVTFSHVMGEFPLPGMMMSEDDM